MSDLEPKANRRWIVIPWALFVAAVVGWSAYWMLGAREVAARMDSQAMALRGAGYTAQWSGRSIGGYPFRYYMKLADVKLGAPDGWGASAPALEAEASALTPGVIVLVAPRGLTLNRPGAPALTVTGDVLRLSVSGLDSHPPRVSIEGQKVRLVPASGGRATFSSIDRFEAHLTPEGDDKAGLFLRIDKAAPTEGALLARVGEGAPVTVGLEGTLSQASRLTGGNVSNALSTWLAGGGQLNITAGGIAFGETPLVSLKPSTVGADANGYLTGKLRLSTARAADTMMALGEITVLPPETAAVASGVGAGQALFNLGGNEASVSLPFHNGQTWLGPIPLGPAPRLFKPDGS